MTRLYSIIEKLHNVYEIGYKISILETGINCTTNRTYYGEMLFTKIVQHTGSVIRLLPNLETSNERWIDIDVSSIASLTRDVMEAFSVFNHICIDKLSKEEFEFRIHLLSHHQSCDMLKIIELLGFDSDNSTSSFYKWIKQCTSLYLTQSNFYQNLDIKVKQRLLKGEKAFLRNLSEINNDSIGVEAQSALYRLFSTSTHSFPLGIQNVTGGGSSNPLNKQHLLSLSTRACVLYLSLSIRNYIRLRWRHGKLLTDEEKSFIHIESKRNFIEEWILTVKEQERILC
ncbi:MAG: hypothetical protein ACYTXT_25950 [Nostoc sp.]